MRHNGKVIATGDVIHVMHGGVRTPWTVSDFSPATGCIYGRREGGPYERLPTADPCPPPPPAPLTPEERKAERARVRAERAAHIAARDQCIRDIRERDRVAGIVTISSGHLNWRSRY